MSKRNPVKNFVVYLYLDEFGIPFYVGKGRPDRPYQDRGRACKTPPHSQIHILYTGLDEETAFAYEIDLIHEYGRRCMDRGEGLLENITSGGEGASGSGKPRNWFHLEHGLIQQVTITELANMYPEQNLSFKCLSAVVAGVERSEHKGWVYVDPKDINEDTSKEEIERKLRRSYANCEVSGRKVNLKSGRRSWKHPEHGVVENVFIVELLEMFPDQNLSSACLSNLAKGKGKVHRGWEVLPLIVNGDVIQTPKITNLRTRSTYNPHNWCHVEHGYVPGKSCSELIEYFSEEDLNPSCVYTLASGKIEYYRGWICVDRVQVDPQLTVEKLNTKFSANYARDFIQRVMCKPKEHLYKGGKEHPNYSPKDWCHRDLGFVPRKSISDLVKEYPEQRLKSSSLSRVVHGLADYHKGWIFIPSEEINQEMGEKELKGRFSPSYARGIIEKARYAHRRLPTE
jgi:hypothetical protein